MPLPNAVLEHLDLLVREPIPGATLRRKHQVCREGAVSSLWAAARKCPHLQRVAGGRGGGEEEPPVGLQRSGETWCQDCGHSENRPWALVGDPRFRCKIPIL